MARETGVFNMIQKFKLTTKTRKIITELVDKCETQSIMLHRDLTTINLYNTEIKKICNECETMVMSMFRFHLLSQRDMQYVDELNLLHVINDIWAYYMGINDEREIELI